MRSTKPLGYGSSKYKHLTKMLIGSSAIALLAQPAMAQEAEEQEAPEQAEEGDAIVVEGIRATIQDSIEVKRRDDLIVDALSADEIGDLPALSIGEALETLTGAASHREQGGATEIAIRGLGPFLSSTVINGRLATNGSGDRSVNFSQFPSELFNKVAIFKTQSASLIEGGVAGQIALETVKPLDYGKQRLQAQFKLNYNPQNFDIDSEQRSRDFGYRGTVSYVDQFQVGGGEVGISLGYQRNTATNPEQEANVSNTVRPCVIDPTTTSDGVFDDGNCDTSGTTIAGLRDGSVTDDFVIARNSYVYRQNITDDVRDAFFGALQVRPNDNVDINLDFQYSNRSFDERRNDLNFSEGRRIDGPGDPNRLDFDLIVGPNGELQQFTNETRIETGSEFVRRDEEYIGTGLSVDVQATSRLRLTGDLSYSETTRTEEQVQIRFRLEDGRDIFGNTNSFTFGRESDGSTQDDRVEAAIQVRQNGSQIFNVVLQDFDVNNHDLFAGDARLRADLDQDRFNSIFAARGDLEYSFDGLINNVQAGVRYQDLIYRDTNGGSGPNRIEINFTDIDSTPGDSDPQNALTQASLACRTSFPESGFLSSVSNGVPLVTTVDSNGVVTGSTNSFATFDALCLAQNLEGFDQTGLLQFDSDGIPIFPDGSFDSIENNDVREITWAGYVQANYDGELGSLPVRGNFGLRIVHSDVTSRGFRGTLNATTGPGGEISINEDTDSLVAVEGGGSYTELLPSANFTAELGDNLLGRLGVFRALSRPDPSSLGFGREFNATDETDDIFDLATAIGTAQAFGNPFTEPLLSWNFDAALEWYPNPDTILAVGAYYKSFNGGFETVGQIETFTVFDETGAAQNLDTLVTTVQTSDETSSIFGIEATASHNFSYLPAPFDGLGFKLSYNFATSDFEFQDDVLGAITTVNPDGTTSVNNALIPPSEIFGLSEHVLSAQVYYQIGGFDFQGVYKYRSDYFQQFISDPGRIRFVQDVGIFEARLSYKINNNIRFTLEGLNLFNEPRVNSRPTLADLGAVQVFGPRYFAGVRVKF